MPDFLVRSSRTGAISGPYEPGELVRMSKSGRLQPEDCIKRSRPKEADAWLQAWKVNELFSEDVRRKHMPAGLDRSAESSQPSQFDVECVDPESGSSIVKRIQAADEDDACAQAQRLGFVTGRIRAVIGGKGEASVGVGPLPTPAAIVTAGGKLRQAVVKFGGQPMTQEAQAIAGLLALFGLFGIIHGGSMVFGSADVGALYRGTVLEHDAGARQVIQNARETGWVYLVGGLCAVLIGGGLAAATATRTRPLRVSADDSSHARGEEIVWTGRPSHWSNFGMHLAAALLVIPIPWSLWKCLALQSSRIVLTTQRLRIETGVLSKRVQEVELYRVRDTAITQSWWQAMLAIGDVVVETIDTTTSRVRPRHLRNFLEVREQIQAQVESVRRVLRIRENERP